MQEMQLAKLLRDLFYCFGQHVDSNEAFDMNDQCFDGRRKWCDYKGRRIILGQWYIALARRVDEDDT